MSREQERAAWTRYVAGSPAVSAINEKEWQQTVEDTAALFGWMKYHTRNSRGSTPGFPDLVLIRGRRLIAVELKRSGQEPTLNQQRWLEGFAYAGAEVYVWRPEDFKQMQVTLK